MTVILNDNEMSIAPNVGACTQYSRTFAHGRQIQLGKKMSLKSSLKKVPAVGGKLAATAERVKDGLKYMSHVRHVL